MKTLLFLFLFLSFSSSYSQNWTNLFENKKGHYLYRPNTSNTAWIKVVSERTSYKPTDATNEKIIDGYIIMLYKFDCTAKKTGIIRYNVYNKEGEILESINIKEYLVEMEYVNPDSIAEQFLKVFCEGK